MSFAVNSTTYNYQYRPLNHATQQIRLVTLLRPLENDDAIRLDINVFEISEAPPYTALSYVWGPPPSNHDIYIANGRLAIRENLFKFLTEFGNCRDKAPSDQHLWIDQLCIDQSTTAERNHQVQMMSDIYSKANSVIAWLGEGSKKADASPSILAQRGCDMFENMYDAAGVWKHVGEPAALAYVLHNEYFTRIWIVQEFILARQIRVLVKDIWLVDDTRGWERRADTLDDYLRHSVSSSTFRLIGRSSFRRAGGFFKHLDICVALDDYVTNDCADPRDRVYGLLGLVRLVQRVTVDYEKSIDQLYMNVTLVVLQSSSLKGWWNPGVHDEGVIPILIRTANVMGITWSLGTDFLPRLSRMGHSHRLGRFHGHACPITAVGLEKVATTGCEVDRFWFDFQGTRHFIYCANKKTRLADETERLLNEDWQKYVPRVRSEKISFFGNVRRKYRQRMSLTLLTRGGKGKGRK